LSTKKLYESFPGVPYGLKNSQNFIKAVKDGDFTKVAKMLQDNKWLAHVFDFTGQTPLHWAVNRNHYDIAKLLLDFKAFVDVNDYVRFR
jgi:ankyrin repeat protein